MNSETQSGRRILVTGATAGIGLALARGYEARGEAPLLLGRRAPDDIEGLTRGEARRRYLQVDLASPTCGLEVARSLDERGVAELDLLVLNAGVGHFGGVAEQAPESIEELVAVNLVAPLALVHALYPRLAATRGKIVFISSIVAALACPKYAVYAATKAALDGFARSLRIELGGTVRVQVVHPGATRTEIHANAGMPRSVADWDSFPSAEATAAKIRAAIAGSTRSCTIGAANKWVRSAGRHFAVPLDGVQRFRARRSQAFATRPASQGSRCLVTGVAAGIGRALAQRFAKAGYEVTGVDCDGAGAAALAAELARSGHELSVECADLAEATEVRSLGERLAACAPFDVVIHNAGINATGAFTTSDLDQQRRVVAVNLLAPLLLTRELLHAGALASGASLVCVSSLSRFVGYPGAAVYAATKDGLAFYARSLAVALAPDGVHVLTVYPGPTRTEHARRHSPEGASEAKRMPPELLADRLFRATQRRRRVLIPAAGLRVFAGLGHGLPRVTEWAMKKMLFDKLEA